VPEIPLTQNRVALVDPEDFDKLAGFHWHFHNQGYAARRVPKSEQVGKCHLRLMHREILGAGPGVQVDHVNGDKLDTRRCNLRLATRGQNQANSGMNPRNTSGYRGVTHRDGKWVAQTKAGGQFYRLGSFDNPEDAARAYDLAAVELFGEFARLNFPPVPALAM
jgi:hypothetical protein